MHTHHHPKLLAIGNSFSRNATEYLPCFAQSQGRQVTLGHAALGGWSLEKHWTFAQKYEAAPNDPEGKPYTLAATDGQRQPASLKQMLLSQGWDIVTLQQHSWISHEVATYQPFVSLLAEYVRRHAPQAVLWMHETWAYRADHPLFRKGLTQERMYQGLHHAYATVAAQIGAQQIIPVGTAFQDARQDPRWQLEVEQGFDPQAMTYPQVPRQVHMLCTGWHWNQKQSPPCLAYDGKHCAPAGKYLGTLVWHQMLFGDFADQPFVPPELSPDDAAVLQDIARRTMQGRLEPHRHGCHGSALATVNAFTDS
ncbi:MAG: DUF4886 domain-containing protein [Phycisphaeraceae bacterium]